MKIFKYWTALFFLIFAVASNAQTLDASFSCEDFEIAAGETKVIKVNMTSKEENIYGFQVRITIPEELSFAPVSGTGTRAKFATLNSARGSSEDGFSITTTKNMADIKSAVFLSTSTEGYNYYETSGLMFSFAVTASADITAGSHSIKFSEIEITKDINVPINPSDFEISAKVLPISVTLNKITTSIMEGNAETLIAKLLPGEVVAGTDVTWTTSDSKVATVNNGIVTAVTVGVADITVTTSNGKTATCTVTVTEDYDKTANKFKTDNAAILGKTTSTVASSDLTAISKALDDYSKLSDAAKAKLSSEKSLLDNLKTKAEEIKAAEEADAAATAEADKFKTENAAILGKTTSTVKSSDLTAISKALDDYSKLSDAAKAKLSSEKSLLDNLKTKAEEIKEAEEADAAATAEADKFKTDNAAILSKTTSTVTSSDLTAISKALDDYSKLSDAAKAKLTSGEKALLDALKTKAEEIKAAEEADAAATAEADKFKTENSAILGKTTSTVKSSDLTAISKALDDYSKLSEAAKAKLTSGEKTLLDNLKTKAEEIKAAEEADAAATAEADKFKTDNAAILGKTTSTVKSSDLTAISKALDDYSKLSDAAKAKLTSEKALLDALKATANADKDTKEAVAKFKTDNKDILAKSVDGVTESDLTAINKALEDYGKLSEAAKSSLSVEKKLLDDMKAKIEKDQAIAAEVEKFKTDNADILDKSTENITSSDLDAINKALDDYNKLSDEAKDKLTGGEKDLLDSLKEKAEELKKKEDADKKATEDAENFKDTNKDILDKEIEDITADDLDDINKALDDYDKLSDEAKDKLKDEKEDLDKKKEKAEEMKAAEDADKKATEDADNFKDANKDILDKKIEDITADDLDDINKALDDYDKLSDEAKDKLKDEKDDLDKKKEKAEEMKAAEEADKKATEDAENFKEDNKDILDKKIEDITSDDLDDINKALDDYDKLSDEAKDKLKEEKEDLDKKKEKVDEIITGITNVANDNAKAKRYNLSGNIVNKNYKGVVIINGKKYRVK